MDLEEAAIQKLNKLRSEFPRYSHVWHKADGRRGLVTGWLLQADHSVRLRVDYGEAGAVYEYPGTVSTTKLVADTPGDEWKDCLD